MQISIDRIVFMTQRFDASIYCLHHGGGGGICRHITPNIRSRPMNIPDGRDTRSKRRVVNAVDRNKKHSILKNVLDI